MSSVEENRRISVSEDRMRLLLADFKIELMRELASYATLTALAAVEHRLDDLRRQNEERITKIELWRAAQEGGETEGRRFSAGAFAWATLAAGVFAAVVTLIWLHHK